MRQSFWTSSAMEEEGGHKSFPRKQEKNEAVNVQWEGA